MFTLPLHCACTKVGLSLVGVAKRVTVHSDQSAYCLVWFAPPLPLALYISGLWKGLGTRLPIA